MDISQKILSDLTVFMKYAKYLPEKQRRETWEELVDRNKEMHLKKFPNLKDEIESAYKLVYEKKILPSMRSLQFAGKSIEINPSRIYNCCYRPVDDYKAFSEAMFLLLSGVGFGFSVQKHHVEKLPEIKKPTKERRFLVGDSIEGWSDAVKALIKSYLIGGPKPRFDFGDIRQKGALLVTSGGKAPGPEPLKICLVQVESILSSKESGDKLRPIDCHDILCHIADAVLAGGIRRCLPENYEIQMSDGHWKKIKDVAVGEFIIFEGNQYPVLNKFDQGNQKLVKISTKTGFHVSTENHRWLIKNKETGIIEWRMAKELINLDNFLLLIKK